MKSTRKIILIFLLMIINSYNLYSQRLPVDTINIDSDYYVVMQHPGDYKIKKTNYEEGYFQDLIVIKDNCCITIHCGTMIGIPLIEKKKQLSMFCISGLVNDEKGMYIENNKKIYCREINILPYNINIVYDRVSENLVHKYDFIFNNLRLYKRQKTSSKQQN